MPTDYLALADSLEEHEIEAWATKTEHQGFASDYDRGFVLAQTEVAAILSRRENQGREKKCGRDDDRERSYHHHNNAFHNR